MSGESQGLGISGESQGNPRGFQENDFLVLGENFDSPYLTFPLKSHHEFPSPVLPSNWFDLAMSCAPSRSFVACTCAS